MMPLDIDVPYLVEDRNTVLIPNSGDYDHLLPPTARQVNIKGYIFYAVPNTPEFNSLLYAAGVPVPSPIFFSDYDWAGIKIYSAQAQMAALLTSRRRCYNLSALGAGKTIGSLLAIDWFIKGGEIKRALIAAPLSILWTVWEAEVENHFYRLVPAVLHGTKAQRLKILHANYWNVGIINHDGIGTILDELIEMDIGCIVIDEAASYRDARTRRWGYMHELVKRASYVAALTGSPTPNYPSDSYGLGRLVTPHRMPKTFRAYRQKLELEVVPNRWIPRKGAAQMVAAHLQPAVRFLRSDITEIADAKFVSHRVALSPVQQQSLDELKKEATLRFPEGTVNAINAATLLGKLLQISAGAVYTQDKKVVYLEPQHRIDTCKTLVEASEGKVIVLTPFIHTTHIVADELGKAGVKSALVVGDVAPYERTKIFKAFQDQRDPLRVIVAHPRIVAHGLNLTQANTIIWWAPIFSREIYEQANGRIIRMGQKLVPYIVHLCGSKEEEAAYRLIEGKGTMQQAVLDAFQLRMEGWNEAAMDMQNEIAWEHDPIDGPGS